MVKVTYPSGVIRYFMWINSKYGYYRKGKKILRYPLPDKKKT